MLLCYENVYDDLIALTKCCAIWATHTNLLTNPGARNSRFYLLSGLTKIQFRNVRFVLNFLRENM